MMNRVRVQTRIEVKTAPQASLGLKTLARMLTLNSEELLKLIEQELEENPALEATDEERIRVIAPQPPTLSLDADSSAFSEESDSDDWLEMRLATPPMDLKAHVLGQLRLMVAPRLIPIAEHLVESLDSYGYLRTDVEEVALYLNAPLEDVEYVLEQLQGCDPPGVGARDLRECLLLQLRAIPTTPDDEVLEWTRRVLHKGWDEFSSGRWGVLGRKLKLNAEAIEAVKQFIRNELRPYPAWELETPEPPHEQTRAAGA
jgi:RNA polymerase sigma-54 factor